MSYGKVKDSFWTDKKILSMSDDAKLLALYFLTGPHRNILGCMRVPDGYIMADLGWPSRRLADAIEMLSESLFVCRDDDGWTLILNQLKHDPIKVPNHITAAIAIADTVPQDSPVFQALYIRLMANLDAIGKASEWHVDAKPIPEPLPEPEPIPEPKPEPERFSSSGAPNKKSGGEPDEVQQAFEEYNAKAESVPWPVAKRLTQPRKQKLKARLSECGGIEGWRAAMARAAASDFLTDKVPKGEGHENWSPDIDFFLQPQSFTKLMEGSYDNRTGKARNGTGNNRAGAREDAFLAGMARAANRGLGDDQVSGGAGEEIPVGRVNIDG